MARKLNFWKMHGLGNDYIVIDNRNAALSNAELSRLAVELCRRRYGIGADGLLAVCNSEIADVKMEIFNADGTQAEMCGNGIRCLAKYCYENGIVNKKEMSVETLAGTKKLLLKVNNKNVRTVTVDMGIPSVEPDKIPINAHEPFVNKPLEVDGHAFMATAVSIGNPHCVIFVDDVATFPVDVIGPKLERHALFPQRTNVEFVEVLSKRSLRVRVWERGVGETAACGTGACAGVAVAKLLDKVENRVIVEFLGGKLHIKYVKGHIMMEGPAEKVFEGVINV